MTVCVAALYNNGEGVILASDRMVTAHIPIGYEFEHQNDVKIVELEDDSDVYVMIAGDVLSGHDIINVAKTELVQRDGRATASEAAEIIRMSYQKVRLANIVQRELEPRGLDLSNFYARHQQLSPQVVHMIDQTMQGVDLGVEILVAGPDSSDKAHSIHTIENPGIVRNNNAIGFGSIGSGSPHVDYYLIEGAYNSSLNRRKVVDLVKKAKRRSEVAPGVGKETTIIEIPDGKRNETK